MYIVLEIQKYSKDQIGIPTPIYSIDKYQQAESEFHRLCSIAAVSQVLQHTIVLMEDTGYTTKVESYYHGEEPV